MFEKTAIIYTIHTVVPAGLEVFDAAELADNDLERVRYMMRFPSHSWQWLWRKFIVECDGRLIGKLGSWRLPDVGYIFDPAVWGQGYAGEALSAFIARCRARRVPELTADTDPRNGASIRLLQRHGFTETGRAANSWLIGGLWYDSIYWRLAL